MRVVSDTLQRARKYYRCDACKTFYRSGYSEADLTPDEIRALDAAEADDWMIKPGSMYRRLVVSSDGRAMTMRYRLDVEAVCIRHDLFGED